MTARPLGCLFEIIETLVLTLVIFFVIQTFVAQPYRVEMSSMEHSFLEGQYVLVDKLSPRWDDYSRGEVVVFDPPAGFGERKVPFIKRVIGLPGETVAIRDGRVWINGSALDEDAYTFDMEPTEPSAGPSSWVVGAGQLFVLGDHRQASSDSRVFGPINRDSVIGRAWLRYWPFETLGIVDTPAYTSVPPGDSVAPGAVTP